jgi:hypothetical protein
VTGMRASYLRVLLAQAVTLLALYWMQAAFI